MRQINENKNKNHSRVSLSGIPTLFKIKADETPDTNPRGWHQAFTLIELLVVVLIIGILAAIALPQYQKTVEKTRMAERMVLVRAVANAEKIYYLANGRYTNNLDDLDLSFTGANGNVATTAHTSLQIWTAPGYHFVYAQPTHVTYGAYPYIYYTLDTDKLWCGAFETDTKSTNLCRSIGQGEPLSCADLEEIKCYEIK